MDYYDRLSKSDAQNYQELLQHKIEKELEMYINPEFPIKANTLPKKFQLLFIEEIDQLQKEIFPNHEIKHLPISPGGELTILSLVLSAFSGVLNTAQEKTKHDHFFVENEQFRLTFHRK